MKKIALLMDGWKRYFTYAWPSGIMRRLRETEEKVNLYMFNSAGNWSRDDEYNEAERVVEAVKKTDKPVIAIGQEIEDFYYVGIDNRKAIREVMEHLMDVHDCKHFWFVMGSENNYENQKRLEEIELFLEKRGLVHSPAEFFFESFEYECGINGFTELMRQHKSLPDAIVCANDNIAVGVCEAAKSYGYSIPESFLVTGFDNFDKASYYNPDISTVSHIREDVGYLCADLFLRLWKGEKPERFHYTSSKCIFGGSCGCVRSEKIDEREYLRQQILYNIETQKFEQEVLSLEYDLIWCRNFGEMVVSLTKRMSFMRCDALYLVLDESLNNYKYQNSLVEDEDQEFRTKGYPPNMRVEFAYGEGKALELENSRINGIFPMFENEEGGKDYLFLPLHFRRQTVGYFVIRNAVYLMEKQYLHEIITTLTNAIENLHKKEKLAYMNERLSELYIHDAMSGLYNRMGGMRLAKEWFSKARQNGSRLTVLFIDLDRLKYINDNLGHERGDFAIQTVSAALLRHYGKKAVATRLGGDEFLVVTRQTDMEETKRTIALIREEIAAQGEAGGLPITLSISVGCVLTNPQSNLELDDYVSEADNIMYQEKTAKKASRTD